MPAARERWMSNRLVMWLSAVIGGGAIHLLLWQFSEPPNIFNDFYKANLAAAETIWEYGLNATWPLTEQGGFSNLPALAWICVLLVPLGEEAAAWTFLGFGLAATLAAWALLTRLAKLEEPLAAGLLFLFLVNGPIVNSLREGQSSHFILLLLVVALLQWRAKRGYAAGIALGLSATFKLPLLLLGVYFLLRQRWRIVAGGATMIGVVVLASLALYGVNGLVGWYKDWIEPFLGGSVAAFNVQSINGFLIRLTIEVGDLRDWELRDPPTVLRIARLCASAALFAASYWLIWRANKTAPSAQGDAGTPSQRDFMEFVLVLTLALLLGPATALASEVDLAAAKKEGQVVWYTSTPIGTAQKIANLFQAETGIKVELFRSGGSAVLRRFMQEMDARRVIAAISSFRSGPRTSTRSATR